MAYVLILFSAGPIALDAVIGAKAARKRRPVSYQPTLSLRSGPSAVGPQLGRALRCAPDQTQPPIENLCAEPRKRYSSK